MKRILCIALSLLLVLTTCTAAFAEAGQLILPAGTKVIGDEAFLGSAASSVVIPDGTTSIGSRAFADNDNLTDVTIPASVTSIADDAFGGSGDFTISAPEGSYARWWWDTYDYQQTALAASHFRYTIEDGEVTITGYKYRCEDMIIPARINGYPVTAIGDMAFYSEGDPDIPIVTVVVPEGVTYIGESAFNGCWDLESVSLPSTLRVIGDGAFCDCSMDELILPEGLTTIGSEILAYSGVEKVYIPSTVTSIGDSAFCSEDGILQEIIVSEDNACYASAKGILYTKDMKTLLAYPGLRSSALLVVPDGVEVIAQNAFLGSQYLERVTLPDSLITIETTAFRCCYDLKYLYVPESVEQIASDAFEYCDSLTLYGVSGSYIETYASENGFDFVAADAPEDLTAVTSIYEYTIENDEVTLTNYLGSESGITLPDTIEGYPVRYINEEFSYSELKEIVISASVVGIDEGSFNLSSLESITVAEGNTAFTSVNGALYTADMKTLLAYPGGRTDESFSIPEGVNRIGALAFDSCENLKTVLIPDSVTEIGEWAFLNCSGLTEISIPGSVTTLGTNILAYCTGLSSVTLGEGIPEIPADTFVACISLEEIILPSTVTAIGEYAFCECNITEITLPENLATLSEYAFADCYELQRINVAEGNPNFASVDGILYTGDMKTLLLYPVCSPVHSLTVPDGVEEIAAKAFYWNDAITEIILPDSMTAIGDETFYGCSSLKSVTLPDTLVSIGSRAFYDCDALTFLRIPGSVTSFGENIFGGYNYSLRCLEIGDGMTSIPDEAFYGCGNLEYVYIPESVTSIGTNIFGYSMPDGLTVYGAAGSAAETFAAENGLTFVAGSMPEYLPTPANYFAYEIADGEVTITEYTGGSYVVVIPDEIEGYPVRTLAEGTIYTDYYLNSVTIPASVTCIEEGAFEGSILEIKVDPANENYVMQDDVLFTKDMKTLLYHTYDDELEEYVVPDGVERIAKYAFICPYNLDSVTMPDSVTSIGEAAFYFLDQLETVRLSANLTAIEAYAFESCYNLYDIAIPTSVTTIGENAFWGCALTEIDIPAGLTSLSSGAFFACSSLQTIRVADGNPAYASRNGVLYTRDMKTLILYPAGNSATAFTVPDGVTAIGDSAFAYTNLTNVTLHEGVTTIGDDAFYRSSISNIDLPEDLTSIGESAFSWCSDLTSIVIPEGVTTIGKSAFEECESLVEVTLPDSLVSIDDYAFQYCYELSSINFPDGLTSIGSYAFESCYGLTEVSLPDSVTSLGDYAFVDCNSLESGRLSGGMTSVEYGTFSYCYNLTDVTIPESITAIDSKAFWECYSLETIYGEAGSYAETFASENGYAFVAE